MYHDETLQNEKNGKVYKVEQEKKIRKKKSFSAKHVPTTASLQQTVLY